MLCLSAWTVPVSAQSGQGTPAPTAAKAPPARRIEWGAPVRAALWPLGLHRSKGPTVDDPFVRYGASEQTRLANQLAGSAPSSTDPALPGNFSPAPGSSLLPAARKVPEATADTGPPSPLVTRPYPWPAPVTTGVAEPGALPAADASSTTPQTQPENPVATEPQTAPVVASAPESATPAVPPSTGVEQTSSAFEATQAVKLDPDEYSRVLAVVGNQSILAGDLLGPINQALAPYQGKAPEWEIAEQREMLLRQQLPEVVKTKLLFLDVMQTVPADRLSRAEEKIRLDFHKTKVNELKEAFKAGSLAELDVKLRETGSSLAKQERNHFENIVCRDWLRSNIKYDPEVTPDEMLAEYRNRAAEYARPARVKWERLTVRFDQFATRASADAAIRALGDQVLRGAPLEDVARRGSQCPNASLGGQYDWTRQGSLASKPIDEVLFSIPAGRLSRILEDEEGLHIIRVIERQDAGQVPFTEVQDKLTNEIRERRFHAAIDQFLEKLKERTSVWTVYDDSETTPPTKSTDVRQVSATNMAPASPHAK